MKKLILSVLLMCFVLGCGKPIDFSNNQYAEFSSIQDLKTHPLNKLGFHVSSLEDYLPLPASAKDIRIYEETGKDSSIWWVFDVSDSDYQEIEKSAKGNDPCPFNLKGQDKLSWIPAGKAILGVHSRDKMTWIGVDPANKRVYCLKYTM